ncbi:MAG: cell wall-binding repeat-containing protein [Chloroflexota bacterium]
MSVSVAALVLAGSMSAAAATEVQTRTPAGATQVSPAAPLPASSFARRLSADVYGFLPYWEIDSGTDDYLRYDLLTDIALFSVGFTSTGAISTSGGGYAAVMGSTAATIVDHAHAAGVRVDLTVTSFGYAKNAAFFADATAMSTAVTAISGLVASRGLDGVDLDVELLYNANFAAYGAFVGQLRAALTASNPDARVSVATNGALSGAGMAMLAVANGADRVFLMGYSYRSAGSSPAGSIAPIVRAGEGLSLTTSLDQYALTGVPANRILLGLPYFGRSWITTSGDLHATTTGSAGTFIPGDSLPTIRAGTVIQEEQLEASKWFAINDPATGIWTETYFDDTTTLRTKYNLATSRGLAGVGIWTLGYDRGIEPFWGAITGAFGTVRMAGPDRYATAAAVSADAYRPDVPVAYIATGAAFPDALAAAAAAGAAGAPVLLVTVSAIPSATAAELARLQPGRIVVVGGPSVVSDAVLSGLGVFTPGGVIRVAGTDRYATAAALSAATYPGGAPIAYLANGAGFADAVSAAPAAARDHGPVLLTRAGILPGSTLAELVRLAPTQVVLVGGASVVNEAIAATITAAIPGVIVSRLAGPDRFATSAAVAATFGPGVPVVYAATGLNFPDALAGAAAAGAQGSPMLITLPTALPLAIRDQIARLRPGRAVITGGPSVVSDAVLAAIRAAVASP